MRLLPKVFWLAAFLAATFCWMVLFQHGFTWQGFTSGARQELAQLVSLATGFGKKPAPSKSSP
ncbi:MAG: hypothetical protein ACOYOF_03505 [Verrucomicrobiaceae bacterium]